jgi:hypothetical protein
VQCHGSPVGEPPGILLLGTIGQIDSSGYRKIYSQVQTLWRSLADLRDALTRYLNLSGDISDLRGGV